MCSLFLVIFYYSSHDKFLASFPTGCIFTSFLSATTWYMPFPWSDLIWKSILTCYWSYLLDFFFFSFSSFRTSYDFNLVFDLIFFYCLCFVIFIYSKKKKNRKKPSPISLNLWGMSISVSHLDAHQIEYLS